MDELDESFVSKYFNNYVIALWTLLITSTIMQAYNIITKTNYFMLITSWSMILSIFIPLYLNHDNKNKILLVIIFIATIMINFVLSLFVISSNQSVIQLFINYLGIIGIGFILIIAWNLIRKLIKKKAGNITSELVSSLIIIFGTLIVSVLIK